MSYLREGMRGAEIKSVQTMLNKLFTLETPLVADGIFGQRTRDRVLRFQKSAGIPADGIVGPMTSKALLAALMAYYAAGERTSNNPVLRYR